MNVLVLTPSIVDFCNGRYYNNTMSAIIPRYKYLGNHLICLNVIRPCNDPTQNMLDMDDVEFINVHKVNSLKSLLLGQHKNADIVKDAVRRADICIVHLPSFIGEQVLKYAKKQNKPILVFVVGCAWDVYWNYGIRGKLIAPYSYYRTKRLVANTNHVVYVTQQFLQERYPTRGKSIGCSNVILPPDSIDFLSNRLREIQKLKEMKRPVILATLAAVDVRYKGQEYVIQAISKLKEKGLFFEYWLIGGGNPAYLKGMAKRLGVVEQVKFYGKVQHDRVSSLLAKTDIYIQSSKVEGLPRALIEAMGCACPALGSDVAGIPELLDEACIFKAGNIEDVCECLISFSPDQMEYYAKRNYEEAENYRFSILTNRRNAFFDEFLKDNSKLINHSYD